MVHNIIKLTFSIILLCNLSRSENLDEKYGDDYEKYFDSKGTPSLIFFSCLFHSKKCKIHERFFFVKFYFFIFILLSHQHANKRQNIIIQLEQLKIIKQFKALLT
jgi:hypothetical protein